MVACGSIFWIAPGAVWMRVGCVGDAESRHKGGE